MGALAKARMTANDFVEWSADQGELRHELESGQPYLMAPEQARHALLKHAVSRALEDAIEKAGLNCTVFPDGMQIVIDDSTVRIPDASVQCAPFDPSTTVLNEPIILVEVVSPSSGNRDQNFKLVEYFSLPSVQHYLLLFPEQKYLVSFKRGTEKGQFETMVVRDGDIELSPPGISIDVSKLFERLNRP